MNNTINRSPIFVLDQDAALDFYTNTSGRDVADDVDLGFMRWLTAKVPGDPGREILLEIVVPPAMDEATAETAPDLLTKGAMRGWMSITTDDAQAADDTLSGRGVDINDELSEKPYRIDLGIRDPFGNAIRIGQLVPREEV